MKKTNFIKGILACAVVAAGFIASCKKDAPFTEKDAILMNDTLLKKGGVITYSVGVVSVAEAGVLKSASADTTPKKAKGAIITVSQYKKVLIDTTDENGIAVFSDMRIGNVVVNVKFEGHATITYVADLTPAGGLTEGGTVDLSGITRTAATVVPMFATTGSSLVTISGKISLETDLTNTTRELAPAGTKVVAAIDLNDEFRDRYITPFASVAANNDQAGRIIKLILSSATSKGVVDANGMYSLQVPSTASGIPIRIDVADTALEQKLLMKTMGGKEVTGIQSIRTIFGTAGIAASIIPNVSPAFAVISAPAGNGSIITKATAVAVLDNSNGIAAVHITDAGAGYADPTGGFYLVPVKEGVNRLKADSAWLNVYVDNTVNNNGRITKAVVSLSGASYTSAATVSLDPIVTAFSGKVVAAAGVVTGITINEKGLYRVKPSVLDIQGGGAGFIYTINWVWTATASLGNGWAVGSITVTAGGTGFLNDASVAINTPSAFKLATSKPLLTTGTITAISVTNPGDGYTTAPTVVITGGGGDGAAATAHIDPKTNKIDYITVDAGKAGTGYTSAPTVTLQLPDLTTVAKAFVSVNKQGVVDGVTIDDAGTGYYGIPTVTINPAIAGIGSGATAVASINTKTGLVTAFTLLTGGSGYLAKNLGTSGLSKGADVVGIAPSVTPSSYTFNVYSGKSVVKDVYLGTGQREIKD